MIAPACDRCGKPIDLTIRGGDRSRFSLTYTQAADEQPQLVGGTCADCLTAPAPETSCAFCGGPLLRARVDGAYCKRACKEAAANLARRFRNSDAMPVTAIVGNSKVRELAGGVSRQTLIRWRSDHGFPDPLKTPGVTEELWDERAVRRWLRENLRRGRLHPTRKMDL